MRDTTAFWMIVAALAAGTFLMRSLPLWLHGRTFMPRWVERFLRYVPAAALTALVVPGSLYVRADGDYEFAPARVAAACVALIIAVRTKSVLATMLGGMAVLWTGQALLG